MEDSQLKEKLANSPFVSPARDSLVAQALRVFLRCTEGEAERACDGLKKEFYRDLINHHAGVADVIPPKLRKVDEAFSQLSRIKKLLALEMGVSSHQKKVAPESLEAKREDSPSESTPLQSKVAQSTPFKRKWRRAQVKARLEINDFQTGIIQAYPLTSLSAGGCLVKGQSVPDEFQFSLEISPTKRIHGIGKPIYRIGRELIGVEFKDLSFDDENRINREVSLQS